MAGKIYPPGALMLRFAQGTATSAEDGVFELSTGVDGSPLIRSEKTGKFWSISWQELLGMADEAGISRQEEA